MCFSFCVVTCWDLIQNKQKEWMFSLWVREMSKRMNKGVGILFPLFLGCLDLKKIKQRSDFDDFSSFGFC